MALLNAANEFFVESLKNYNQKRINFSILHAITATELLLKERLSRINPNLIYKRVDSHCIKNEDTVSLRKLPQRLINLGIKIPKKDAHLITKVAKWRNEIVHHMPTYSKSTAIAHLCFLYDFLARFLRKELKVNLKEFFPTNLYSTVNGLLKDWGIIIKKAKNKAKKEGNIINIECPNCGIIDTLSLRENKIVFCHLCEKTHDYGPCTGCGKDTIGVKDSIADEMYCDDCIEAAGDAYIQLQTDIALGK